MNTRTLGKILGALGLVALLSAPYTYFVTTGSPWMAGAKAVLGLALVGAYFATNLGEFGQFASRRSTFYLGTTIATVLVVLAALVAVNYVVVKKGKSWDLTTKKIFTLAPQTKSTLGSLKEKVRAYAFLAPSDPDYEQVDRLLQRYREQAPDRFEVVFKDPRKAPDLAQKYQLREGQTTLVLTRGSGDQENHTTVSVSGGVTEQDLTNALIKLSSVGEQKVYFTTGHGEWPLDPTSPKDPASLSELKKTLLQEGYVPGTINLADGKEIPKDAALIVIAGARSKFGKGEAEQLGKYLGQGGRMLYFAEAGAEPGLDPLLAKAGIQVDPGLVADDVYAIDSPYLVVSHFFGDTDLARDLKKAQYNLQFPTVRGLTVLHDGLPEGTQVAPVLTTSPNGFEVKSPTENPQRQSGDKAGSIPLIVQSTRNVANAEGKRNDEMRLVAFGDSEILVDPNWGDEPNRNMVMNAFAWATSQVQKITIRPPDRDISTVDLDPPRLARIRFVATDLMPFSLLAIGLAVWLNRRSK
ncbi:MAG TPA: GldG family protein [Myxococcaceae bacterium]|nr:GldG family protein [Myxococcaceae bacterium]